MAAPSPIPAIAVERYDALIATCPGIERKGASMPYTSMNGHMFSFLTPDGTLALRLPSPEREQFMTEHGAASVEQHGRVLKEYVAVPSELFARTDALVPHFVRSRDHVALLKPAPSRRKG
jgi:hypothetical protein